MAFMANTAFAKNLRREMAARDMQPRDLAYHADVGVTTIYRYLSGDRAPHSDILHKLASVLHVSTDELLGIEPRSIRPLEVSEAEMVQLPLLRTRRDVTEGTTEMVEVPRYTLPPDLPVESLCVVLASEDTPDLLPEDLVVAARDHDWSDGDLLAVLIGDEVHVRRVVREGAEVLAVGPRIELRDRVPLSDVVGRVMTYTRRL